MEQRQGRIVTIISDAGRMGEVRLEVYSGAKAGAAGVTRAMARTLARHNIRANNVAIAAINTPGIRARRTAVCTENLSSDVVVMKSAQDGK